MIIRQEGKLSYFHFIRKHYFYLFTINYGDNIFLFHEKSAKLNKSNRNEMVPMLFI